MIGIPGGLLVNSQMNKFSNAGGYFMRQLTDENIAKKKERTLTKHFTILVNGEKQKILNYKIKPGRNDSKVKTLELISKFKFATDLNTEKPIFVVIDKDENLNFEGTFSFLAIAIGNYSLGIILKR